MKKSIIASVLIIFLGAGCARSSNFSTTEQSSKKNVPIIATTILPLTIAVKNIVGDAADVQSILPSGAEPHDVVLSPRELLILQHARIVVKLGLGLDTWADKGLAATGEHPIVISVSDFLGIPENSDPHVWLSPRRMMEISDKLGEKIAAALPESTQIISENTKRFHTKLENIDTAYKNLATLQEKNIVTLHNAFSYLAADYGLHIVGVIQDLPEDSPTPADVARIISVLKKFPDAPLFAEAEIQPALITAIAHDANRTTHILNPLETGSVAVGEYERVMMDNLGALQKALSGRTR